MKCMAGSDRVFRVLLGILILGLGIYFHSWWGAVGLMPLLVGAIGRCPDFHASHKLYLDKESLSRKAGSEEPAVQHPE